MSTSDYDPNDILPSPAIEAVNQFFDLPIMFDISKPPTPSGMHPSNHSSLSSPPRSTTVLADIFPFDELVCGYDENALELTSAFDHLGTTLPNNDDLFLINSDSGSLLDLISNTSLGIDDEKLRIIAEPKAYYRERYSCETDPKKNRAQRYIRAQEDNSKYEYPTVKIPQKWCDPKRQIFIRVTPVTIRNKNAPDHCIHPYVIDTQEINVIKDPNSNSIYFRLNENELFTGEKSFHISRKKMIQNELRSYGPFRLFGSDQPDIERVRNPHDPKQKIAVYQLWKSQFVFTIAERYDNNSFPVPILQTSVVSQIMVDEAADGRIINHSNEASQNNIRCIPQKGDWHGGDDVLIIMPNPIKRKVYSISFNFGQHGQQSVNEISHIDTRTILFRTPACPMLQGDVNVKISIIIQENSSIFTPIDFYYITPMKTTTNLCPRCLENPTNNYNYISNKRRCEYDRFFENDCGDGLISQMNQLIIEKKTNETHSRTLPDEKNSKYDKYLNQLKDALTIFVRTSDPSRLFRRTRVLLSKFDENSSPLSDAIERGHIQLALSLIEQVVDMPPPNRLLEKGNENGETPLLIAAKLNHGKIIETILKKRSDLAEQKDKDGNNIFHLLANLSEDKGAETIENILTILPNDLKINVLKEKNTKNETPVDIGQLHGNTQCIDLLKSTIDIATNID